jgi:hypothetical protein
MIAVIFYSLATVINNRYLGDLKFSQRIVIIGYIIFCFVVGLCARQIDGYIRRIITRSIEI